jgi:hypothetical protein
MLILMKTRSTDLEVLDASRRRDLMELIAYSCNTRCERVQIYQMKQLYHTVTNV